jgi:hypothetical protein
VDPAEHKRQIDTFQHLDRLELAHTFLRACTPARRAPLKRVQTRRAAWCMSPEAFEAELERSGLLPIVRHLYPSIESQAQ